jgi:lipid-A-disaccharide synthase
MPKYYVISGEASGDLHGSNLIKELKKLDSSGTFRCWGGDLMQAAGGEVIKHYKELAFMGFAEVIKNLPAILSNFKFCKNDILKYQPDVLILIDYPGFNLRIAQWAKSQGIKVIYYISPQVWAWKENRVKTIKNCVDKMLVILPFEKDFYRKWHYDVEYVGHPLVTLIQQYKSTTHQLPDDWKGKPIIAVLPGSRKQEIEKKLPIMLSVCELFPDHQFIVAKAPGVDEAEYQKIMGTHKNVKWVTNRTYELLFHATAAMVTSGTATLETAIFGVPQIICYKGNPLSYQIAKRIVNIRFIGLANLIMNKEVVKELIQQDLTTEKIKKELQKILTDKNYSDQIQKDYSDLRHLLSMGGDASQQAAVSIYDFLRSMPAKENTVQDDHDGK